MKYNVFSKAIKEKLVYHISKYHLFYKTEKFKGANIYFLCHQNYKTTR